MKSLLLLIGVSGVAFAGQLPKEDPKEALAALEGTWVQSKRIGTTGREIDIDKDASYVVKGSSWKSIKDGKTVERVIKLDPSTEPKTIDLTFTTKDGKEKVAKGIYKQDGDTLTVAIVIVGPRPTEFKLKEGDLGDITIYKRTKP